MVKVLPGITPLLEQCHANSKTWKQLAAIRKNEKEAEAAEAKEREERENREKEEKEKKENEKKA